jgi:membrane fusion protein, copper/silver efflux system
MDDGMKRLLPSPLALSVLAIAILAAALMRYRAGPTTKPQNTVAALTQFAPGTAASTTAAPSDTKKLMYYRNPMGAADTSSVPKKDQMGMDYIPVYEGDHTGDGKTITLSPQKIQRSGVRTEVVEARVIVSPVRGVGTIKYDERRITAVTPGVEGFIDEQYISHVGAAVRQGQPLFRIATNNFQMLQVEIARRNRSGLRTSDVGVQNLLTGNNSANAADWPSPANGTVIEKRVVTGQRIGMAEELMRIADTSKMWVVADVAESQIAAIKPQMRALVNVPALSGQTFEGVVLFIYPELRQETRTGRVAIEVANPDGQLKAEMVVDVTFRVGADQAPVIAVPDAAVIADGREFRVLIAKTEGRFEARSVRLGLQGSGFIEVLNGVAEGESVVTTAAFLIDAESNLQAALATLKPIQATP